MIVYEKEKYNIVYLYSVFNSPVCSAEADIIYRGNQELVLHL